MSSANFPANGFFFQTCSNICNRSIECEDGKWRPVAYLSKSLNEMEHNYEVHDKEMLAVIRELKVWRHLLKGAKFKFEI